MVKKIGTYFNAYTNQIFTGFIFIKGSVNGDQLETA